MTGFKGLHRLCMLPDWQPARQADAGMARAKADDAVGAIKTAGY